MRMYEVSYNTQTSYVSHMSNCFYYRIQLAGLLYDGEHDLLVIAKFLVI